MYLVHRELNLNSDVNRSLKRLFWLFIHSDKELFLVGGCVRDLLLGKKPKDYDLCTNATPEEIKEILDTKYYHFIDTGLKHGTITVHDLIDEQFYEITTYRIDGEYTDARHPSSVEFTKSLEEDLKRRDFTINSFAYNLITEELIMLDKSFMDDLKFGIIRTVGRSTDRFKEDALRMLRAFRFAAQTGFSIDTETYEAIVECAPLMANISKERIRDELTKILLSDNPRYLELFVVSGVEKYSFDGKEPLKAILTCEHQNPYHYTDVFHHTLDVVERVPKKFELRWAALFHDMGKPYVKRLKEGTDDHYTYYGHDEKSTEIALELMEILKFSNLTTNIIEKFVKFHDFNLAECKMSTFKKVLREIGPENFLDFMKLREADSSAHCLLLQTKYAINHVAICYDRYKKVMKNPLTALEIKDLHISGYELMQLGLKGKQVGDTLRELLERVLENPDLNTNKILIHLAKEINDGK